MFLEKKIFGGSKLFIYFFFLIIQNKTKDKYSIPVNFFLTLHTFRPDRKLTVSNVRFCSGRLDSNYQALYYLLPFF